MDEDLPSEPGLKAEWVRQNNLMYVALIGLGLILIQPFLTATELDLSAKICVVSFAAAIPLLAGLALLSEQEEFRNRMAGSLFVTIARSIALAAAIVGVVAAFWHVSWIAGAVMLASGVVAVGVHSAGYTQVEGLDNVSNDGE